MSKTLQRHRTELNQKREASTISIRGVFATMRYINLHLHLVAS